MCIRDRDYSLRRRTVLTSRYNNATVCIGSDCFYRTRDHPSIRGERGLWTRCLLTVEVLFDLACCVAGSTRTERKAQGTSVKVEPRRRELKSLHRVNSGFGHICKLMEPQHTRVLYGGKGS